MHFKFITALEIHEGNMAELPKSAKIKIQDFHFSEYNLRKCVVKHSFHLFIAGSKIFSKFSNAKVGF